MWTAHNGPSLFWPSKVCISSISTMLILQFLYNIVRWRYKHIRLMLRIMPPLYSSFFFSSSRLSPTATAPIVRWVMSGFSFSSALTDAKRFFLFFFCSDCREEIFWLEKILENWICQLQDSNRQPSSLFTIEKLFRRYRGLNPGLQPYHVFSAFTACRTALMQTWN